MTENSDSSFLSRRFFLQTLGATGVTGLAGCSGDSNSGTKTSTSTATETTATTDTGPNYSLPESEHKDTVELVSQWGNNFPEAYRLILDSYSPEQVENKTGVSPIMENTSGTQYQMFDWGPWVIPETIVQSPDGENSSARVRSDQLPGDVTEEGVIEDLKNDGYVERGQRDGFTIMSNRTKQEARAVGNGYHVLSYNFSEQGEISNDQHVEFINEALDAYSTGGAQPGADVMDLAEKLDIKDTFGVIVPNETEPGTYFMDESPGNYDAVSGATTLDIDQGKKYAAWKFNNAEQANMAYQQIIGEDGEFGGSTGFNELSKDGRFLMLEGNNNGSVESILYCTSPKPII